MDFTLFQAHPEFKLNPFFSSITNSLHSFGFEIEIEEVKKSETRTIESAFLKANTKIHLLKIASAVPIAQRIQLNKNFNVKFEVDIHPPLGFETEVKALPPSPLQ